MLLKNISAGKWVKRNNHKSLEPYSLNNKYKYTSNLSATNAYPIIHCIYVVVCNISIYLYFIIFYICILEHERVFLVACHFVSNAGHVGTTSGKLELLGEGARGSFHHGLRSFSPVRCGAQCLLYRQTTKFDTSPLFAAVVSSTAWAARLFSGTSRTQLSKGFWSSLKKSQKNAQSWKFWIQMLICWFPLCSSQVLFQVQGDLKRIQFPHISMGQAGDTLDLKNSTTTTRRELLVDRHLDKEFWSNQCSTKRCSELFGSIFCDRKQEFWAPKM